MAASTKPALVGTTKEDNSKGVTKVSLDGQRKVTYLFNAITAKNLSIPYAVAVDGIVPVAFAEKPLRVSGDGGKITISAGQGQRVQLYLNSDAHPDFRKQAVYAVVVGEQDILIKITEKTGKHTDSDTPVKITVAGSKNLDVYEAPLTGDIWMKVSHKYEPEEVDARLPTDTSEAVKEAVKRIYEELPSQTLEIREAATADLPERILSIYFSDSNNPKNNISNYSLLVDGLTRVHPAGYAALFSSALNSSVVSLELTSCWRPMLGSIAHRAGLGLDVAVVGDVPMRLNKAPADDGPNLVKLFRAGLLGCACIKQLFDPWVMESDAYDQLQPVRNKHSSANERLHSNHLHVTVSDPKIL